MVNENEIRDKLGETLDLLEPGLSLLEVNHKLPNELGGKGFVDILARDRTGKFVIIELKRSDQSARSALFEILKYMPLFRRLHGVSAHQVRCFIVSTTWHELLVPFSEFCRLCETQTEGFAIGVDDAGSVIGVERVLADSGATPPSVFRVHGVYLYEDQNRRSEAVSLVSGALSSQGAEGFLLFELDYEGGSPKVNTRYALYAVPTLLTDGLYTSLTQEAAVELNDPDEGEPDRQDIEDLAENTFMARVNDALRAQQPGSRDALKVGTPEKFTTVVAGGWTPSRIHRHGPYASTLVFPDEEIVTLVEGTSGANSVIFERISSPSHQLDWDAVRTDARTCLRGNVVWQAGFNWFMDKSAEEFPDGNFLAHIYNPLLLMETLYQMGRYGRIDYCPLIDLVIAAADGTRIERLFGTIVWDGHDTPDSVDHVLDGLVEEMWEYFLHQSMGTAWQFDEELMKRHHLRYGLWWMHQCDAPRPMLATESGLQDAGEDGPAADSINDYFDAARSYLDELFHAMDAVAER